MSYAYNNQDSQKQALIGQMSALMKELQNLAPHPDTPNYHGPLFIKSNPNMKAANDHDGMLGSLILESVIGVPFAEAASETFGSWTENVDAMAALECYSEYITDIEGSAQKTAAHGQGTLARLSGQSISGGFNMRSNISAPMQAFMNDMPKRMKIETELKSYADALDKLDAAPQYNAPKPRFAA